MPASFITFIVIAVLAVVVSALCAFAPATYRQYGGSTRSLRPFKVGALLLIWILAAIPLVIASTTIVSTRNIGVVTTFGKPTGHLSNGLHVKAPWSKVTELDGSIQIENRTGRDGDQPKGTQVRLGNNSIATVENSVQWRIQPAAADSLFLDYRSFDNIRDNLVVRQANAALNDVLAGYNPLASLEAQQNENQNEELAQQVAKVLRDRVGDRIEIKQVLIPVIHFDADTQRRIDQFNAEVANTRIAEQKQKTADAEAQANDKLRGSVADPNVLVSKCLDIVSKNGGSPAGCWPGGAVIANGK